MFKPLYQHIANTLQARQNCIVQKNTDWQLKHETTLNQLADLLPSGGGIDSGSALDWSTSTANKLVIHAPFHHMQDGYYTGWTEHTVTVRASLLGGLTLQISGRNRNAIKDYLQETFAIALLTQYKRTEDGFLSEHDAQIAAALAKESIFHVE